MICQPITHQQIYSDKKIKSTDNLKQMMNDAVELCLQAVNQFQ
jgi:hypothetical protein